MDQIDISQYPTDPGVYLMQDAAGAVLYVGKAKNLRARLRTYAAGGDGRVQIPLLLEKVVRIETIVTDTEKEALILENTLIKKHHPRYNIDLRDDKTYVSVRIDPREEFPALQVVRRIDPADGALYFGPFASAAGVRETLKQIYRVFPLRHYPLATCRRRGRPCLFHQIGQCSAPCHGRISAADYGKLVEGVVALLDGREQEVLQELRARMQAAAAEMAFEEAARLRDRIRAIEATLERQKVVDPGGDDVDAIGLFRAGGEVEIAILFIRNGKLVDRRSYPLRWELDAEELLSGFLQQFYGRDVLIPATILLPQELPDAALLQDWLCERRGRKVRLVTPQRGEKVRLVRLAHRNARESYRLRGGRREARQAVLEEVQQRLHLPQLPRRIECFDISTIQGARTVGSMTVLIDGELAPKAYRRFQIKTVAGADDYAALHEVLSRRLRRGLAEGELPDMILVDGGKGQLGVVADAVQQAGLTGRIALVGIAKSRVVRNVRGKAVERSEERFFLPGRANPVVLRAGSPALFLLEHLRDEAHRFAITYHRKLRGKAALASILDGIPGVGPGRRTALLKHFGSVKKMRSASLEELEAVPGVPAPVAEAVFKALREGSS